MPPLPPPPRSDQGLCAHGQQTKLMKHVHRHACLDQRRLVERRRCSAAPPYSSTVALLALWCALIPSQRAPTVARCGQVLPRTGPLLARGGQVSLRCGPVLMAAPLRSALVTSLRAIVVVRCGLLLLRCGQVMARRGQVLPRLGLYCYGVQLPSSTHGLYCYGLCSVAQLHPWPELLWPTVAKLNPWPILLWPPLHRPAPPMAYIVMASAPWLNHS